MGKLTKGLVQVYTGNAKGKSTAAFGLALRAAGQGLRVQIVQFMKTGEYGENKAFEKLAPEVEIKAFGRKGFIHRGGPKPEDYRLAEDALSYARDVMTAGKTDLLILDEINNALYFKLLAWETVEQLINSKPEDVELVLTGRNAPPEMIQMADLVTEMLMIKHPFEQGISARKGIEF